jgi:single-stranded DNA-binding protein
MANDLNSLTFSGRLGDNPKIVTFENGGSQMVLNVANNYKDKGGTVRTLWMDVIVPNPNDFLKDRLKKGAHILISEARLTKDIWVDQETQKNMSRVKIFSPKIQLLS